MSDRTPSSTGIPLAPGDEDAIHDAQVLIEQFNHMLESSKPDNLELPPTTYWHRRISVLRRQAARARVLEELLDQAEQGRARQDRVVQELKRDREHLVNQLQLHQAQAERLCSEIAVLCDQRKQWVQRHNAVAAILEEQTQSRAWRITQLLSRSVARTRKGLKAITPSYLSRKSQ